MSKLRIEKINALAELERCGWPYEPCGDNEVRLLCPVHDDESPSVNLNVEKNVWQCNASHCKAKGDIIALLAYIMKTERGVVVELLSERYDIVDVKTINPTNVEKFHKAIKEAGPLLKELYKRGVTDEDIRKHRLGYYKGRITIPVYDRSQRVVNVRRYLPGAPGPEKMRNTKGYAGPHIFGEDQIDKYDEIWLCGGEMKAIVAQRLLNPHNVGAIAVTAGEGSWDMKWNKKFKDKNVFLCYDIDNAGRAATRRVGAVISKVADAYSILLPLDKEKHPKGDINDFVGQEGGTAQDLLSLMQGAPLVRNDFLQEPEVGDAKRVPLSAATKPAYISKRVEFEAVGVAMDTNPYLVPKAIGVNCTQDQKQCFACPVFGMEVDQDQGYIDVEIPKTALGLLEMVNNPLSKQRDAIRLALNILLAESSSSKRDLIIVCLTFGSHHRSASLTSLLRMLFNLPS